jgi:hypothetical protein
VLSDAETFAWGSVGSVVALLVVQVLPWAISLAQGADFHFTFPRLVGALLVLAIFIIAGGVVAMLVGDANEAKQAIAYGLGWQGLIGGFIQGTRATGRD